MIIEPRMRGFICLTAHPAGCEQNVKNQIEYVKSKGAINGAKKVLVIGASTGFGLASRISSAFGSDAATIGVFFEKPPMPGKTASLCAPAKTQSPGPPTGSRRETAHPPPAPPADPNSAAAALHPPEPPAVALRPLGSTRSHHRSPHERSSLSAATRTRCS